MNSNHDSNVIFLRKQFMEFGTINFYSAENLYYAQQWLKLNRPIESQVFNIIITPFGSWGCDIKGPFLYQAGNEVFVGKNSDKECKVGNFQIEERSLSNKNIFQDLDLILDIECGLCKKHSWIKTSPKAHPISGYCSFCGALNKFPDNFQFISVNRSEDIGRKLFNKKKFSVDRDWVTDIL